MRIGNLYTRSLAIDDKCHATSALYALRTSLPFFSRALRACLTNIKVMAYEVMACTVMACTVVAHIVRESAPSLRH